uniref:Uncharacterized protein n=1 Tax=Globisporangium ultimum (strain ATCC 200006 / CBS 805.95 / DAOM BR144) TaxID=431595 RepID=K3WYN3_GLOUD
MATEFTDLSSIASTPLKSNDKQMKKRGVISLRSLHESISSSSVPETDLGQKDIECLEDGVNLNARKFNEHKLMVERRQKELNALLDELRALQLETQELSRIQNQETPISKKNNKIKQDISECTASMEEQMHLRRQLEHMLRRLQTNQLRVDAQILAMSKAVDESLQEAGEVKLLCRQLEAGKARAVQFLQEVQLQIQVERKARARELGDHEVRAKNSQKMESWRLQRIQERAEIAAELRGDLSADEEMRLIRSIENRERANEALHLANLAKSQKAADFEEVLDQLKLSAGATSLAEVVEKICAQSTTAISLEKEKAQAEAKLIAARQEKEQAVQTLNELKASGIGGIELNREVYNTLESEIQQAKATLKVNKSAYERLDSVISGVRQGSFGLAQRLKAFDDALDTSGLETNSSLLNAAGINTTADQGENADCLAIAELKLTKMLELIGQQNSSVNSFGGFGGDIEESVEDGTSRADMDDRNTLWSPHMNNDPVLHRNNIRVRPGTTLRMRQQNERDDAMDSARSDMSGTSDSGSDHIDVLVPSRDILKMSSSRHFSEIMRKKELVEKQKVAAEKGISDEEMMSKLRKQNQLEADTRLSTSPTRQQGLMASPTGRDGAKSKSIAFVTQLNFNDL